MSRLCAAAFILGALSAASASGVCEPDAQTPYFSWTASSSKRATGMTALAEDYTAAAVKADLINAATPVYHIFVMPGATSEDVYRLTASNRGPAAAALASLRALMTAAPDAAMAPRSCLAAAHGAEHELVVAMDAADCTIVPVAAEGQAASADFLSRSDYMALASGSRAAAAGASDKCVAYLVKLNRGRFVPEVGFMVDAYQNAQKTSTPSTFVFAGDAGRPPVIGSRALGATSNSTTTTRDAVRTVPEVLTGLLIGAMLLLITVVGLSCVMSIATPDVMHSETLLGGKEF